MFKIIAKDRHARCGQIDLSHGMIETPVFMPVGTQGTVKAISVDTLKKIGFKIILGNTYHLYLKIHTIISINYCKNNDDPRESRPLT